MKILYVVPVLLMFNLTGCATQSSLDNVRNDIDAVKTRLFSVERDLGEVRTNSKESIGSVEKSVKAEVANVRRMSADIQATIDSTKGEMRALNGRLDDMGSAVKKPTEDLTRYRDDADKRIFATEDSILKLQATIDELSKKMNELMKGKSGDVTSTPDALYMKGLEDFKSGDMPSAREKFTKFIEQNPQHDLVANAYFWIGETHYSEKNYESAILAYQEVIKKYPGKEKVTAAMLKQAMAFMEIKDVKSAKYVLKKLSAGYPKSGEAKKAKAMLKDIK
ncbi:MAG: tol-pal system protein YbgF [Desulfuromonadaceae bacterium]|nr:tol-pal system protein YbgF [Desulfuromonadaceae bacterium]